jgi:hypothetical protein
MAGMAGQCRPFVLYGGSRRETRGIEARNAVADSDRSQDRCGSSLDPSERLGERGAIAAIQVDVISRRIRHIEADRVSNHERDSFGFELARVTRAGTVVTVVKKFMRLCDSEHKHTYVLRTVMCARSS